MTHTATPWSHNYEHSADIRGADGKDIAIAISREMNTLVVPSGAPTISAETRAEAHANAEFIVRACNAHDDLVGSATTFSEIMEPFASLPPFEAMARFKELCASGDIDLLFFELARAAKVSKAALSKATHE